MDGTNAAAGLGGWKKEEFLLLMEEVRAACVNGLPLKRVFDSVARKTGRKPNSVRNFYYMQAKTNSELAASVATFVPFRGEEVEVMLKSILTGMAHGRSVRACAYALGGDEKGMLRYQNKFRSVVKNNRQLVERIMRELSAEGKEYANPYEHSRAKNNANARQAVYALVALNRGYLDMAPMQRIAELTQYLSALESCVSSVEAELR